MNTKICSRCGIEKPLDAFRPYYNRSGTYRFCRSCERIETRYKYLTKRGDAATPSQIEELARINTLYDLAAKHGLDAPGRSRRFRGIIDLVDAQLAKLQEAQNE